MHARLLLLGMSLSMGFAPAFGQADDPLTRPIASTHAAHWLKQQPPVRVFGNSYSVGFEGLSIGLIKTSAGLILIDGNLPQAVPAIKANLRRLGLDIRQVKLILSTEPHADHAGGIAALARDSGATVVASARAAEVLKKGGRDPADPQAAWLDPFPAVDRIRIARDGEEIRLGDTVVTAVATPGHTLGSMSWAWRSCEGKRCANMIFASSFNPVSAPGWRFSDPAHRGQVQAFRSTFASFRQRRCDILFSAHPEQSGGEAKYRAQAAGRRDAWFDAASCRSYADRHARLLDAKLAKERAGGK